MVAKNPKLRLRRGRRFSLSRGFQSFLGPEIETYPGNEELFQKKAFADRNNLFNISEGLSLDRPFRFGRTPVEIFEKFLVPLSEGYLGHAVVSRWFNPSSSTTIGSPLLCHDLPFRSAARVW
jgi:hypothetical protein